jgi:hypothetical protein
LVLAKDILPILGNIPTGEVTREDVVCMVEPMSERGAIVGAHSPTSRRSRLEPTRPICSAGYVRHSAKASSGVPFNPHMPLVVRREKHGHAFVVDAGRKSVGRHCHDGKDVNLNSWPIHL